MAGRFYKFFVLLLAHIVMTLFFFFICLSIIPVVLRSRPEQQLILFSFHAFYCLLYFVLLWKDLYSRSSTMFFSPRTWSLIVKNLFLSTSFMALVMFLTYSADVIFTLSIFRAGFFRIVAVIFIVDMCCSVLLHFFQFGWIRLLVEQGYLKKNVIIIGKPDRRFPVSRFFSESYGTKIYKGNIYGNESGWFFSDRDKRERKITLEDIPHLLWKEIIGEVLIFIGREISDVHIYMLAKFCRDNSIAYSIVPDIEKLMEKDFWNNPFSYIPVIEHWESMRDSLTLITCKRFIDLILVSFSLLIAIPIGLIIAVIIKCEDGGPVFYISRRVGKNGKVIKFYKFRSMVVDADKRKRELLQLNRRKDGPLFKIDNDPRETKTGRILRRFSLDELPQLINVLRGDISLVGPRPHLVDEVALYTSRDRLRLECFPGITCYPQIFGNTAISFRKVVDLDLSYRRKWSLFLDMKILASSLKVSLFQ
ncbi:MAG: sugar transferase [Spirochaetales bacterium]|nr:sugar transferase [Spirochaetales bacterium]